MVELVSDCLLGGCGKERKGERQDVGCSTTPPRSLTPRVLQVLHSMHGEPGRPHAGNAVTHAQLKHAYAVAQRLWHL